MGLLTTDKSKEVSFLKNVILRYYKILSITCYISAIIVSGALITEQYVGSTYFSDDALLPGLVNREFNSDYAKEIYGPLKEKIIEAPPYQFIYDEFKRIGLNVYEHTYTLHSPFGAKNNLTGKNIFAIFNAPRAGSTEALVLSTPLRPLDHPLGPTTPGIALMFALAKFFSLKNYWAKDIIYIVYDHDLIGLQAWLEAYHDEKSSVFYNQILPEKSGPIQAALNLEIHGQYNSRLEIKIEGLNGQLPNLDLFNVAVELAARESVTPTFHGRSHPFASDFYEAWSDYALTISSMMASQATTLPTGAHGLFQKYAIQSITLEAIALKTKSKESHLNVSFIQLGRVIEGIFRSLNNLLERFHRSYWFYLLPSTRRYISIGYYMIPYGLFAMPLILEASNIYLSTMSSEVEAISYWNLISVAFLCHSFIPVLFPYFLQKFFSLQIKHNFTATDLLYYSLVTFSFAMMFTPLIRISKKENQRRAHKCIALLNLALLLSCLSLFNISLALILTIIYVPIVSLIKPSDNRLLNIKRAISKLLLFLLHPLVLSWIILLSSSIYQDPKLNIIIHIKNCFLNHKKMVMMFVKDWYIFGNWTYLFTSGFLFPVWLQFWYI